MDNNIHINPESLGKFKALSDVPSPEGYESPVTGYINQISHQIIEQRDNAVVAQINEQIGVNVDKHELIRALNYDRNQFNEGYRKGYRDAWEKYEETNRWTKITYRPMTKEEEIEYKREFGIVVDEHGHDTWSFGCCISHDWRKETYMFINFLWWSISIGWLIKESEEEE